MSRSTARTSIRATKAVRAALLAAALVAPAGLAGQACPAPDLDAEPRHRAAIVYLADDALEGRLAGSPGERCAGDFIAATFRSLGLEPAGDDGWFQDVPLASAVNPHAPGGTGRNVVGLLRGADPGLAPEHVIIGAHYDHLGRGGFGSLGEPGAIHNGADDNASGVGVLLAAAERLARGPRPDRSVVFVAFTGEESGLLGSARYAAAPALPLSGARAMLNMDMVGRLGAGPLIVYGTGTAEQWPALLGPAAEHAGLRLAARTEGYGPSDHTSFYTRDVPVLHFFTNVHSEYHRPEDDAGLIDYAGIERVTALVTDIAGRLARADQRLTLLRGAGQPPAPAGGGGGYGAYLGSVPDFTPVDHGVRLSGVSAGSPAEEAGIRGGDTIVRFGAMEVGDLYDLTEALREHAPGDRVAVVVLRDGAEVEVTVTLGSRNDR